MKVLNTGSKEERTEQLIKLLNATVKGKVLVYITNNHEYYENRGYTHISCGIDCIYTQKRGKLDSLKSTIEYFLTYTGELTLGLDNSKNFYTLEELQGLESTYGISIITTQY